MMHGVTILYLSPFSWDVSISETVNSPCINSVEYEGGCTNQAQHQHEQGCAV